LNLHRGVGPTEAAIVALRLDLARLSSPLPPRLALSSPPAAASIPSSCWRRASRAAAMPCVGN
jgi:hypothetical protein